MLCRLFYVCLLSMESVARGRTRAVPMLRTLMINRSPWDTESKDSSSLMIFFFFFLNAIQINNYPKSNNYVESSRNRHRYLNGFGLVSLHSGAIEVSSRQLPGYVYMGTRRTCYSYDKLLIRFKQSYNSLKLNTLLYHSSPRRSL